MSVATANETMDERATDQEFEFLKAEKAAIRKSLAVIEFRTDGTIITANDNFLNAVGYSLEEIEGQHHRIFVEPKYGKSKEYKEFWKKLNRGEYVAGEFQRVGKDGKEIWIQASYNPIEDLNGKPYKIVKYATDVTEQKLMNADFAGQIQAVGKSQAVIEFNMDGTIITANENFISTVGYSLEEIEGQHHRMFVDPKYGKSKEYKEFWKKLNRGEYVAGEFQRVGKDGKEIWIQASYNPIEDLNGKPFKIVKYATDVTEQKLMNADFAGQIQAVGKSQAVIEFNMDGTIITANENFISTVGYSREEIEGQHHRMFVETGYGQSDEYKEFWRKLNRGEYVAGEFKRVGKDGKEIWIQASYNPIEDLNGKPYKIVKYATDVTEQKLMNADFAGQIQAVGKSQAVIEFNMDGTIIKANDNFLNTVGYTLEEIQGQHHRLFVEKSYGQSVGYKDFWARLNRGEYVAGEFKRVGKGGKEIWIQASYNPIEDLNGKPFKVVKYATDVSEQVIAKIERRRKVDEILEVVTAAAKGDLTKELNVPGDDAVSELAHGIDKMIKDLRGVITQVVDGTAQFNESSRVIAESSQGMAEGSQTQNAAVEEMSTAVNELIRSIQSVKENSADAETLAKKTSSLAEDGSQTVQKSVEAMDLIKTSSSQISEITQVISEIAGQTNLLALNAAIEAARAGQHGRGFAVVADEVRKLAERSSEAAKEISTLIRESTQRVEDGVALSETTGAALHEIVQGVAATSEKISEIASSTVKQAENADEVSHAIQSVSQVTESSAASSEQMASSAEQLGAQASSLGKLVSQFQL